MPCATQSGNTPSGPTPPGQTPTTPAEFKPLWKLGTQSGSSPNGATPSGASPTGAKASVSKSATGTSKGKATPCAPCPPENLGTARNPAYAAQLKMEINKISKAQNDYNANKSVPCGVNGMQSYSLNYAGPQHGYEYQPTKRDLQDSATRPSFGFLAFFIPLVIMIII